VITAEALKAATEAVKYCEDRDSESLALAALEAAAPHIIRAQQARIERVEALAEYPSTLTPDAAQLLRAALNATP